MIKFVKGELHIVHEIVNKDDCYQTLANLKGGIVYAIAQIAENEGNYATIEILANFLKVLLLTPDDYKRIDESA